MDKRAHIILAVLTSISLRLFGSPPTINYNQEYNWPPSDTTTSEHEGIYTGNDLGPLLDFREDPRKIEQDNKRLLCERKAIRESANDKERVSKEFADDPAQLKIELADNKQKLREELFKCKPSKERERILRAQQVHTAREAAMAACEAETRETFKRSSEKRLNKELARCRYKRVSIKEQGPVSDEICLKVPYIPVQRWTKDTNPNRGLYNKFEYPDRHDWEQTDNANESEQMGICKS